MQQKQFFLRRKRKCTKIGDIYKGAAGGKIETQKNNQCSFEGEMIFEKIDVKNNDEEIGNFHIST